MHDDLIDHAKLQRMIQTPICLDESASSPVKAAQAIEIGACGWINIKPGRVGGLTNALKTHEICTEAGVPVWIGGMLESAVGAEHCIALATLPGVTYPNDIFLSRRFYTRDLAEPEIGLSGSGKVTATLGPGIGCAPDPVRLKSLAIDSVRMR